VKATRCESPWRGCDRRCEDLPELLIEETCVPLLYTIGLHTAAPFLRTTLRPKVQGLSNVPARGGAILAANHLSVADEYVTGATVRRHIAFWAKAEYFNGTGLKGWAMRTLMHSLGAIEVNREGGRAALTALDAAIPALQAGDLVGIYPEGTRSPDGRLYRGRTGVARLALLAEVPVIPIGLIGTAAVQPIGSHFPRFGKPISITFGKPLDFVGRPFDSGSLRAITDEVMAAIAALTGQEYVPRYSPRRDGPAAGNGQSTDGQAPDAESEGVEENGAQTSL
jgi:1-acyl-sn-glycerol-3-phosphate acyltransferase